MPYPPPGGGERAAVVAAFSRTEFRILRFLGAAALFNFGMTVFFLLYNLHLRNDGFHEDFLGPVTTAMTIGSITGTIPAGGSPSASV